MDYYTTLPQLSSLLSSLQQNTVDTPYDVVITADEGYSLQILYSDLSTYPRYVNLKFGRGCTGIRALAYYAGTNRWYFGPYVTSLDFTQLPNLREILKTPANIFVQCDNLRVIKFPPYVLQNVEVDFHNLESLEIVENLYALDNSTTYAGWFRGCSNLKYIYGWNISNFVAASDIFEGCSSLKHIYTKKASQIASKWSLLKVSVSGGSANVTVYDTELGANDTLVTKKSYQNLDASSGNLELFNYTDELLFTSSISDSDLKTLLKYKYPFAPNDGSAYPPSSDNFVLWAKNAAKIITNIKALDSAHSDTADLATEATHATSADSANSANEADRSHIIDFKQLFTASEYNAVLTVNNWSGAINLGMEFAIKVTSIHLNTANTLKLGTETYSINVFGNLVVNGEYKVRIMSTGSKKAILIPLSSNKNAVVAVASSSDGYSNNYIAYSNGVLIQWGIWTDLPEPQGDHESKYEKYFPVAFINNNYAFFMSRQFWAVETPFATDNNLSKKGQSSFQPKTTSSVWIAGWHNPVSWLAIGRWY